MADTGGGWKWSISGTHRYVVKRLYSDANHPQSATSAAIPNADIRSPVTMEATAKYRYSVTLGSFIFLG
ncbi:unnamed protein product [Gongylonema pulchrum]|uniref:Phytocyanin domain-containing protein n=1 Tax=Gongylonema pulchrum TaxID=637853 RepID=A0A183DI71_9BILA|nr:unnamed protein product [Gongylonema pulchrum]